MSMECPHCKHPSTMKRKMFGSHLWAKWECERCGSKLSFNKTRRIILGLSVGAFFGVANMVLVPYLLRSFASIIWLFIGMLVTLPLFMLVWWKLEQLIVIERKGSYCPACGYDLRGNESGQCPECGKQLPMAKEVQRDGSTLGP